VSGAAHALGGIAPADLVDARLQLHWAAQIAAAPGASLAEAQPDFGQLSLAWDAAGEQLVGAGTKTTPTVRAALTPASFALRLLDAEGASLEELALSGRTLDEGMEWLAAAIGRATGCAPPALSRPEHELPGHAISSGEPFSLEPAAAFAELGRWYAAAHASLSTLHAEVPRPTPLRCWPHHFDIAFLVPLDEDANDESARSIGFGLSPGDGGYAEPYLYVTPWPYPATDALPPLDGGGRWHTEGWVGAVLKGSRVVSATAADAQAADILAFMRSGLAAARTLLE